MRTKQKHKVKKLNVEEYKNFVINAYLKSEGTKVDETKITDVDGAKT